MTTPVRIVSLISSATEILYLLGAGDRVVGVSHECDYPAEVAGKPRLTRSLVEAAAASRDIDQQVHELAASQSALYSIDVERLAALRPDLIITQAQCDVCAVRYEDVAAAVRDTPALAGTRILALNPHTIADVFDDLMQVGRAIGAEQQALAVRAVLEARVRGVREKTTTLPREARPRVACLEWIDPPMLAANWTPELVQMAGGEPGLTVPGAHSTYADWDQVVAYDPQVVVIMPCGFDLERSIVEAQVLPGMTAWNRLTAVRDRRVYAADGNAYFNRSGPRLVDSLEILAHLFHPRLFRPPQPAGQQAWRRLDTRGDALAGTVE
jgi:iron complex transport system substrate-binding protein